MSHRPAFTIEIDQDRHLALEETRVYALARIESDGGPATVGGPRSAEVIIIDTSGSMVGERLTAAKRAAKTAVDGLRTDVDFAIVAGSNTATMVYPPHPALIRATDDQKVLAKSAISRLWAAGGTRIGKWLSLANTLFADHGHGIRHAILLTDGKNAHENKAELDDILAGCEGRFVCDCRGVGTDWGVEELRRIADTLLGNAGMVADPEDLSADFAKMIAKVMGPAIAGAVLRIWTPNGARLRFVKQMLPTVQDLGDRRADIDLRAAGPMTADYPTGIWSTERRDYHLCVEVPAGRPYEHMLAARVSMVLPGSDRTSAVTLASGDVLAEWTDNEARSTRLQAVLEHYSKQERIADSVRKGVRAIQGGDTDTASRELGRAAGLAEETGNTEISVRLGKVIDVDPVTGAARPKENVGKADEMDLDLNADLSVAPPEAPRAAGPAGPPEEED